MATGPNGEKRPADVVGCAVDLMREATGQERLPITKRAPNRKPTSPGRRSKAAGSEAKSRRSA